MKKMLCILMTVLMVMTSLVALAEEEEPLKLTIINTFYTEKEPPADNPIIQKIEELNNVDIEVTWVVSGDADSKFNTVMASVDQPMMYVVSSGITSNANYIDMCRNGVFWDLTDYIQEYDIFREELTTPAALAATALDGRNYLFPLITSGTRLGLLYREDWMEALNEKGYDLVPPTNVEEFKAMVEAFATGDPDGNGVDDTIGFAYCDNRDEELDYAGFNAICAMMGGPVNWGLTEDGQLMPYFFFDEYFDTLDLFNWMYENAYMNTDFAINTNKHEPLANSISGSMFTSATGAASPDYDNLNNVVGKGNWSIKAQQEFYTMDGERVASSTITAGSLGGILLPKYSVKDEETLIRILDLYAAMMDADGETNKVMTIGVEGIHYTLEDGVYTQTDEQYERLVTDRESWITAMWPRRILQVDYGQGLTEHDQIVQKAIENEQYDVYDMSMGYMSTDMRSLQTQISTIISDARVKYIMGAIDKDGFIAERDRWLSEGGQEIIDSVNAEYAASK